MADGLEDYVPSMLVSWRIWFSYESKGPTPEKSHETSRETAGVGSLDSHDVWFPGFTHLAVLDPEKKV